MTIYGCKRAGLFTFLTTFAVSTANAQSTNCMAMGPDMVQCYGADGSSTNCMAMGPTMASCNTVGGQAHPDTSQTNASTNGGSGGGFLDYILGSGFQEASFRKKLGKMIAAGDCRGAAKLAYQKGRLELGTQIAQTCSSASSR